MMIRFSRTIKQESTKVSNTHAKVFFIIRENVLKCFLEKGFQILYKYLKFTEVYRVRHCRS